MRNLKHGDDLVSNLMVSESSSNKIFEGMELFSKYLVWVLIPNFIIFIPLGIILIFKNRNFEKHTLIVAMGFLAIPAFYAYTVSAQDTRYLYVLFPIFSVLSALAIEKITNKFKKSNIILIVIISSIFISSIIFYEEQKIDYEHEKEAFLIMHKISNFVKVSNVLYPETSYFATSQTINQWPSSYSNMEFKINTISTDSSDSLKQYIFDSKNKGLTHIILDNNEERKFIFNNVFENEKDFPYLIKIYDSKDDGFNYHVMVFEINFNKLLLN